MDTKNLFATSRAKHANQLWAFVMRDMNLRKRYWRWEVVWLFYAAISGITVALIGVASGDQMQTLNLIMGVLIWTYLDCIFFIIANSISTERWEGTIEYTFMAPVSRLAHLLGVGLSGVIYSLLRTILVFIALAAFTNVQLAGGNLGGVLVIMLATSFSILGLGLIAAIMPLISPQMGSQGTHIMLGLMLLVSGVYYPVDVLPRWLQPFAWLSPATYALQGCRKLLGIGIPGSVVGKLNGQALASASNELWILLVFGAVTIPLGLWIFGQAEDWAKRNGLLKRSG